MITGGMNFQGSGNGDLPPPSYQGRGVKTRPGSNGSDFFPVKRSVAEKSSLSVVRRVSPDLSPNSYPWGTTQRNVSQWRWGVSLAFRWGRAKRAGKPNSIFTRCSARRGKSNNLAEIEKANRYANQSASH